MHITLIKYPHVLYIIIVTVLLYYILLPPSFYHLLGHFLTTLSLRAQVRDLRYRCTRYFLRFFWYRHPFQFIGILVICFCYLIYPYFYICCDHLPLLQVFLYLFMLNLLCILYFFLVLRLSVYTWGYFRSAYIRRHNVPVPAGSGRYIGHIHNQVQFFFEVKTCQFIEVLGLIKFKILW